MTLEWKNQTLESSNKLENFQSDRFPEIILNSNRARNRFNVGGDADDHELLGA